MESCVTLTSMTLTIELTEGHVALCQKQWEFVLALLAGIPKGSLRRIQLCVIFGNEQRICGDAIEQIKRVRWAAMRGVLARLRMLEQIALITKGEDEWIGDHIWQEVEAHLRPLRIDEQSLVVRLPFCFV